MTDDKKLARKATAYRLIKALRDLNKALAAVKDAYSGLPFSFDYLVHITSLTDIATQMVEDNDVTKDVA